MNESGSFDQVKEQVARAIGQSCPNTDGVAAKVIAFVASRTYKSVEPGVDLVESLGDLVRSTTGEAARLGCDLRNVTKGLTVGAFRARDFVRLEAHRVISHLAGLVVTSTVGARGDLTAAVEGFMDGIAQSASEMKLNREEAFFEAANAVVAAAQKAGRTIAVREEGGQFVCEEK